MAVGPGQRRTGYAQFASANPGFIRQIMRLRAERDRAFARLERLPGRDRHSRTRQHLQSPSIHTLYAFEALRKADLLGEATPESVAALASRCNPYQAPAEFATPLWVTKRGRRRLVTSFGPERRMAQMLVADLLRHLHPPSAQQYLYRGGVPAAQRAVEAAYAEGFTHGVEVDLIDFYGSVRLDGLAELLRPLPSRVVEHVVWGRSIGTVDDADDDRSPSWTTPAPSGQTGLALGAASSPIVGERIIASLLAPADHCRFIAYADNILVVGTSAAAVSDACDLMQARASEFDGWPLGLREDGDGVRPLAEGFNFLHHEVSVRDGRFEWAPDQRKLGEYLVAEVEQRVSPEEIDLAERKIVHQRRAYPSWQAGDLWEATQLAALAAKRFYDAASPLSLSRAAQALIASYYANGRLRPFDELIPAGITDRDDDRRYQLIHETERRLIVLARQGRVGVEGVRYLG